MNTDYDFELARQGSLDGLCGIYSIVNFFARREESSEQERSKLLRRLIKTALQAIEAEGKLTAHNVLAGFWQGQLKIAANALASKHGRHVKIMTLSSYARSEQSSDARKLVKSLQGRGAAVLNMREPGHWVLAYATPTGALRYDDPASGETQTLSSAVVKKRHIGLKKGLVLLDAQTH